MRTDPRKLVPIALCPAALQVAQTNNIPLAGIDPPGGTNRLNPGDSITGLITLFEKGGKKTQWLLYVVAAEPTQEEKARTNKPSRIAYVGVGDKVEFSDSETPANLRLLGPFAAGTGKAPKVKDQTVHLALNEGFLGIGLDQAAAANHRIVQNHLHGGFRTRNRPFTEAEIAEGRKAMGDLQVSVAEQRALIGSELALDSYAHLVMETPGIDALFYKIATLPSAWSVVRHAGINVNLNLSRDRIAPMEPATWNLAPETPCYTYPIGIQINGEPGMMVTLVVVPPHPPLLECAGIIGFLAEKPDDKETYMLLQIIGAHRVSAAIR
jgi:hypothetical protein